MTARKPVTAPAIGVDEALGNDLAARKDAILDELQAARQQRTNRTARYDRDCKRLDADYLNDCLVIDDTVSRLERALSGVNAGIEAMSPSPSNVVPMAAE